MDLEKSSPAYQPSTYEIKKAELAKIEKILQNQELTVEERDTLIEKVKKQAEKARLDLDKLDTQTKIDEAKAKEIKDIEGVSEEAKSKPEAKSRLNQIAETKKLAIRENKNLSAEETTKYLAEVEAALTKGLKAIDDAKDISEADLNLLEQKAKKEIEDITPLAKQKSVDALNKAREDKITKIRGNLELTIEEKQELELQVNDRTEALIAEVKTKTSQAEIDDLEAKGKEEIKNIAELPKAKPAAIAAIEEARTQKLAEIAKKFTDGILTAKEKQDMEAKVNEIADTNIKYIRTNDISNADLEQVKDDTIKAIKAVDIVGREKAVTELTELANGYINFIKYELKHLGRSDEEGFIKGIQDILKVYLDLIAKAGSDEEVQELLNKGKEAMKKLVVEASILNDVRKPDLPSLPDRNKEADKKHKDRQPNTGVRPEQGVVYAGIMLLALGIMISKRKFY